MGGQIEFGSLRAQTLLILFLPPPLPDVLRSSSLPQKSGRLTSAARSPGTCPSLARILVRGAMAIRWTDSFPRLMGLKSQAEGEGAADMVEMGGEGLRRRRFLGSWLGCDGWERKDESSKALSSKEKGVEGWPSPLLINQPLLENGIAHFSNWSPVWQVS